MKSQNHEIKNLKTNAIKKTSLIFFLAMFIALISSCSQNVLDVGDRYKVVFWFNEANSRLLLDDNAETLTFYINNNAVATSYVDDIFWTAAPSCDDTNAITTQVDLLPRNRTIFYKVTDQTGFEYFSGTQQLITNTCNAIEIGPITKFK